MKDDAEPEKNPLTSSHAGRVRGREAGRMTCRSSLVRSATGEQALVGAAWHSYWERRACAWKRTDGSLRVVVPREKSLQVARKEENRK